MRLRLHEHYLNSPLRSTERNDTDSSFYGKSCKVRWLRALLSYKGTLRDARRGVIRWWKRAGLVPSYHSWEEKLGGGSL